MKRALVKHFATAPSPHRLIRFNQIKHYLPTVDRVVRGFPSSKDETVAATLSSYFADGCVCFPRWIPCGDTGSIAGRREKSQ